MQSKVLENCGFY